MPRITANQYLQTHQWLAELWIRQPGRFGLLSYQDQMYLHDYFVPSWKLVTNQELLQHRKQVTTERPSLPQCAGRALRRLWLEMSAVRVPAAGSGGARRVVVQAVANPVVDSDRLARALLRAAQDLGRSEWP